MPRLLAAAVPTLAGRGGGAGHRGQAALADSCHSRQVLVRLSGGTPQHTSAAGRPAGEHGTKTGEAGGGGSAAIDSGWAAGGWRPHGRTGVAPPHPAEV